MEFRKVYTIRIEYVMGIKIGNQIREVVGSYIMWDLLFMVKNLGFIIGMIGIYWKILSEK